MGTCGNLWELMGTYGNLWDLMGTYGNLWEFRAWELMGTYGNFMHVFALQGVFSLCFSAARRFSLRVFAVGRFLVVYFTMQVVFSLRVFAVSRSYIACFRCQSFFRCVFCAARRFLVVCFHCRSCLHCMFSLQGVFRCVFCAAVSFYIAYFTLHGVFTLRVFTARRFSLCILYCVAFSLRICVLCRVMFDTFPVPKHTFPDPRPTLLVPMHTFPEPHHTFPETHYVPVCRMYVTAIVNMLLLYVLILLVGCCTFRLYELFILSKLYEKTNNNNLQFSMFYFIRTNNFFYSNSTSFKSLSIYALRIRIL